MEAEELLRLNQQRKQLAVRAFFGRMLLIVLPMVITALTVMGCCVSRYKTDYYENALRYCDVIGKDFEAQSQKLSSEELMEQYFPETMTHMADELGLYFYLFDTSGTCLLTGGKATEQPEEITLNQELLTEVQSEEGYLSDEASGRTFAISGEPMLCRGIPIVLTMDGTEETYYFFACAKIPKLNAFARDAAIAVVAVVLGLTAAMTMLLIYQVRLRARQRDQVLDALHSYAAGDYSQELDLTNISGSELEEVVALTMEIGNRSQRAEESSRQFVSNVSHELRTPMTVIRGFLDSILDGTIPKNRRTEYLSIVSQEVQRLQMLVTSMLNLTRYDAGTLKMNYRPFTLNDTAFRTMLMFSSRLEKRNISVEGLDSPPIRVYADPDLIGQVIYNLVENAVKFVDDGGVISFAFQEEEEQWQFSIRNTGKGISKEELPKIFERFYKSDASRSLDKTGLGLGLDITRRIVHLHNGQICVRSEENAYTEFEVILPRPESMPTEAEPEAGTDAGETA